MGPQPIQLDKWTNGPKSEWDQNGNIRLNFLTFELILKLLTQQNTLSYVVSFMNMSLESKNNISKVDKVNQM